MTTENNFSVYRIWCPSSPLQYIGSTTQKLSQRFGGHARDYRAWKAGKGHYVSSFELMKLPDVRIEIIEVVDTKSKQVLRAREGHWIRTLECVNKRIEGRSEAQYYLDNREHRIATATVYYEAHREEIKVKQSARHVKHRDIHNAISRAYRIAHLEECKTRNREYQATHSSEIKMAKAVKCECACGGIHRHGDTARHLKSAKHQAYLKTQESL